MYTGSETVRGTGCKASSLGATRIKLVIYLWVTQRTPASVVVVVVKTKISTPLRAKLSIMYCRPIIINGETTAYLRALRLRTIS
jgi:hypothetical protein